MSSLSTEFEKPARKAARAGKSAARVARATAAAVASEARTFSRRSAKHLKIGAAKQAKQAAAMRNAGTDAAEVARARLRLALEALQQSSEEMGRWAGAKALEARDQATVLARERPLGTAASILAVGALIGLVAGLAMRD